MGPADAGPVVADSLRPVVPFGTLAVAVKDPLALLAAVPEPLGAEPSGPETIVGVEPGAVELLGAEALDTEPL